MQSDTSLIKNGRTSPDNNEGPIKNAWFIYKFKAIYYN